MSKKLVLVLVVVVSVLLFRTAHAADLIINEIMYNPSGDDSNREWVELYNDSSDTIDIVSGKTDSAWRFDDGGTSLHYINDDLSIPAGGYAVLASDKATFLSEYPDFSGLVADTSMSLSNSGTITIWNGAKDVGSVVCSEVYDSLKGADNDGNSLQLVNGYLTAATPTPGEINNSVSNTVPDSSSDDSNSSSSSSGSSVSSTTTTTKKITEVKIKTNIIANKTLSFVGIPISLDVMAYGHLGEKLTYGKYFWNFGDGDSKEISPVSMGQFTHTYFYPGDYLISLDYYLSPLNNTPDASDQVTIKVIPVNVSISNVGNAQDFFVELTNNADSNADLSNWILASDRISFTIPRNTVISAKKKIIISPRITNFSIADKNTLKLLTSQGDVVFSYGILTTSLANVNIVSPHPTTTVVKNIPPTDDLSDISYAPNDAKESNDSDVSSNNGTIVFVTAVIFIGAAACAVYFIRRKKVISQAGDDFEILDE